MKKNLMFSVVMPCFNCEDTICDSLESILNQTYQNFEILCVDDQSSDNTLKILLNYQKKSKKIKIFRKENDASVASTRNIALQHSKGRFISFLDADDIWHPNKLEIFLIYFKKGYQLVYSDYYRVYKGKVKLAQVKKHMQLDDLLKTNYLPHSTAAYDRKAIGLFYQKNFHFEDYVYWLDIFKDNSPINIGINQPLMEYKVSEYSRSYSIQKKINAYYELQKKYFNHSNIKVFLLFFKWLIYSFLKYLKFVNVDPKKSILLNPIYRNEILPLNKNDNVEQKKFSVIIPCYNCVETVKECLDSIYSQTYKKFEVICVDDGSNDLTYEILSKYKLKEKKLIILKNKSNRGIAYSINRALKISTGQYIAFIDGDDIWKEKYLETYLKYFSQGYEFIFSSYQMVRGANILKNVYCKENLTYNQLTYSNFIANSSAAYDRLKLGIFYRNETYECSDYINWLDIFKKNPKNIGIQEPLMSYRVSKNSSSFNKYRMLTYAYLIYSRFLHFSKVKTIFHMIVWGYYGIKKHFFR